jgi:HEAT repeat protein
MSSEFDVRDRESVMNDLAASDEEVRRLAVERIDLLPASLGIPCLVDCLGDPSWRVRKAGVERLVACGDSDLACEALVAALADGENPGRRNAAVEALVACGPRVSGRLIEECASNDADVRKLAVDALAGIGDVVARDKLLEMLDDADPNVRASAADALAAVGKSADGDALLEVATRADEDQLVRFSAIRALTALEVPARAAQLTSVLDDPVLGSAALALLGRGEDDDQAVEVLLKALASRSQSSREAAIRSLLAIVGRAEPQGADSIVAGIREAAAANTSIVADAIAKLADADLPQKLVLVQFLSLVGARKAVIPVLEAGRDEALSQVALAALESIGDVAIDLIDAEWPDLDAAARRDGCVLFGRCGCGRSAGRLLSALEDTSGPVRTAAARSLGERRLASGLAPLVQRLIATASDDDYESEEELAAVTAALIAIAQAPGDATNPVASRAVEMLAASLEGARGDVRLAIATVIGRVGRVQDCDIVSFLLRDPSDRVRRAAVEALSRLEPAVATEPLHLALADESALVRIAAARALGESTSPDVVVDLERLAADEDPRVRSAAVHSTLIRFAISSDEHCRETAARVIDMALSDEAAVALSALEALTQVGGPHTARASELLERSEPELVREAIRCLAAHADSAELESVLRLVAHPDWSVRAEAIQTLAERGMVRAVPAILRRLETEQDDFVREVTLRALKRLESGVA